MYDEEIIRKVARAQGHWVNPLLVFYLGGARRQGVESGSPRASDRDRSRHRLKWRGCQRRSWLAPNSACTQHWTAATTALHRHVLPRRPPPLPAISTHSHPHTTPSRRPALPSPCPRSQSTAPTLLTGRGAGQARVDRDNPKAGRVHLQSGGHGGAQGRRTRDPGRDGPAGPLC
jgi:hypothetical protein